VIKQDILENQAKIVYLGLGSNLGNKKLNIETAKFKLQLNKIEIINSGIHGADSFTELKLIEMKLLDFSPDMMIIYDGWNDLRAQNSAETIQNNWSSMCQLGMQNNFDVIIALQPIAGFGNKILTEQELEYSISGIDYEKVPLINSLSVYEKYTTNLETLSNCTANVNLRTIFDTVDSKTNKPRETFTKLTADELLQDPWFQEVKGGKRKSRNFRRKHFSFLWLGVRLPCNDRLRQNK
jgi:hypothetical protein